MKLYTCKKTNQDIYESKTLWEERPKTILEIKKQTHFFPYEEFCGHL